MHAFATESATSFVVVLTNFIYRVHGYSQEGRVLAQPCCFAAQDPHENIIPALLIK